VLELQNWIGGAPRPAASGRWLDSIEPATGRPWARVPDSDAADLEAAVRAAREAVVGILDSRAGEITS